MNKYRIGQIVYIVQSYQFVRECKILKIANGFYTLHFMDSDGGIRLRESRLYATREEAEKKTKNAKPASRYDYYGDDYR